MTIVLGGVITFASFALIRNGVTWLMAQWFLDERGQSNQSARQLFWRGVLPTGIGAAACAFLVMPAFFLFEPRNTAERPGIVLLAISAVGVYQAMALISRAGRMYVSARRVTKMWDATSSALTGDPWTVAAFAIDTGFPIVAVSGCVRPRIFVDESVLRLCDPKELRVVAAHELAHIRRHDNVQRLVIAACAGGSSDIARAWRLAAERAADDDAADTAEKSVDLAAALVKIASGRARPSLETVAVSTIADGLELRVRRLVAENRSTRAAHVRTVPSRWGVLSVMALVVLATGFILVPLHEIIEVLVNRLP